MTNLNENGKGNVFTGRVFYPVVVKLNKIVNITFRFGSRKQIEDTEDISLSIDCYERKNNSYDIWVNGKLVANASEFKNAKEVIREYIDSKTGRLKESRLEETV